MDFYNNLNCNQKKAFDDYKNAESIYEGNAFAYHVNHLLLNQETPPAEYDSHIASLDSISKVESLTEDTTLYRACFDNTVNGHLDNSSQLNIYRAFMSTSTTNTNLRLHFVRCLIADSCVPCYIEIKCKKGAYIIPLEKSAQDTEKEVLLPRNSQFKLISKSIITCKSEIENLAGFNGRKFTEIIKLELEYISK